MASDETTAHAPADETHAGGAAHDHDAGDDGHGHAAEALGPLDLRMWGAGLLGVGLGLAGALVLAVTTGHLG